MRDVMHPRLKVRAKEWGRQYVLFDSASYPMFIITLTKTRGSPMGPRQLMDAGCDAARIKALGFSASDVIASGTSVQDMRAAGWSLVDLKALGADASSLIAAGCSVSELKGAGFTALQLKDAGCSAQQLRQVKFGAEELKAVGYDISVLVAAGYGVSELKGAGFTALQLKAEGLSAQQLFGGNFSRLELQDAGFDTAVFYSIISVQTATPDALAQAKAYYNYIEFASQLCAEFAAAESSNPAVSVPLAEAHKILGRIVEHNPLLKSSPPDRQPAWPLHDALIRFDLPLQRYTTQFRVTKKWIPRCFVLRSSRLYYRYLKAENGQDDSLEGSLAFMRSNPAPDGKFCMDLKGVLCAWRLTLQHVCVTRVHRLQCSGMQRARRWTGIRVRDQVPCRGQGESARVCMCLHQRGYVCACISMCMYVLARMSTPPSRLQRTCFSLLPMTSRASAACEPFKPQAQAAASPRCRTLLRRCF